MQTKTFRWAGMKWTLPEVVWIDHEAHGYRVEYRKPRMGEYYLSGAVVEPYRAFFDLDHSFLVLVERWRVQRRDVWERMT